MILSENLKKSNILVNARSKERIQLLDEMLNLAVKNGDIKLENLEAVKAALVLREKSMTTGIGKGLAIPHCISSRVDKIVIVLATIENGLDFAAIDNKPVFIAVLLIVPESKMSLHVKTLAGIAKVMNNIELRKKILELKSPDGILKTVKSFSGPDK